MSRQPIPRFYLTTISRRLLVWLLIGLSIWAIEAPYTKPAERGYAWLIGGMVWTLTILVYEVNAHALFERYLYSGRWLLFALLSLFLLSLIHLLLWGSYPYAGAVTHVSTRQALSSPNYLYLTNWAIIYQSGAFGWLTNTQALGFILGTPYFFASPFLMVQLFRHYLAQRRQTQRSELTNLTLASENTVLELDVLKTQVNPHFLFNSLNSIYVRVIDVDDSAADLVLRLAELMRYNLYEADAGSVTLEQELAYIENYLHLEQARHGQRVDILFTSEGVYSRYEIAPLLLLAFVENAFKHGIGGTQPGAYVWVEAHVESPATLVFTVQNSLASGHLRTSSGQPSGQMGLPNVRQRLGLLYPQAHRIDVDQTADSYSVILTLALDRRAVR